MATTTTDENKELVREYIGAWDDGRQEAITPFLADDFSTTYTDPSGTDVELDLAGYEDLVAGYFEAFSDFDTEVHEMVAEDDRVMTRITYAGVHDGEFLGIDPTGTRVEVEEFLSFRFDAGEITELQYLGDNLDLLRQFGVDLPIEG